jgi:ABC-2 type transport system ATP-binding protein
MELKIDRLTKQYSNKIAVDRVSCTLSPGVIGLLGANGAGKTTLMRMVCGILKPTSGTVKLGQYDVTDSGYRNQLGYLPQDFGYYPEFTGMDFMLYIATLKGLDKGTAKRRSRELLESVNLLEASGKKIKTYSGGMKQRLGIAQVMLNNPQLVVLDEPTAGLDPKERVRFRHIIEDIGKKSIVLLSTHIVSDIEKAADRILVIKDGQKVFDGTEEETGKDLETFYLEIFGGEE